MTLTLKQRRWLLGGALLTTVAWVVFANQQDDSDVAESNVSRPLKHPKRAKPHIQLNGVMSALQLNRPVLPEDAKDMFTAKSWVVAPPPPSAKSKELDRPTAPPLPFTYIGNILKDGKTIVFLTEGERNYAVSTGEIIDGNYSVDSIKPNLITLTYLPMHIQQTLPIGAEN